MGEIVTCKCCGWTYDKDEEGPECPSCGRMFIDKLEPWGISTYASYRPATEKEKKRFKGSVGFWLDTETGSTILDDGTQEPPQEETIQKSKPLHIFTCDACHGIFEAPKRPRRCPECRKKMIKGHRAVRPADQYGREEYEISICKPLTTERAEQMTYWGQIRYMASVAANEPVFYDDAIDNSHKCPKEECAICDYAAVCGFPFMRHEETIINGR